MFIFYLEEIFIIWVYVNYLLKYIMNRKFFNRNISVLFDIVGICLFLLYILNYIVNILFTFYKMNCDIIIFGFDNYVFVFILNIFVRECIIVEKIK